MRLTCPVGKNPPDYLVKDVLVLSVALPPEDLEKLRAVYAELQTLRQQLALAERAWANLQALHDLCPPGMSYPECGVDDNPDLAACVRCWAEAGEREAATNAAEQERQHGSNGQAEDS